MTFQPKQQILKSVIIYVFPTKKGLLQAKKDLSIDL